MGAFALLAVGSVFLGYLGPSQRADALKPFRELPLHEIDALQPGELMIGLGADDSVMAFRPTEDQLAELRALDSSVYDSAMTSYHAELGVFFYWQRSTNFGCFVEHRPKDSHPYRSGWPGGFVGRCHDQS